MRRRKDRHLPPCVYHKHGAYYLVKNGQWRRLASTLPEAMAEYARIVSTPTESVPGILDRFLEDAANRVKPNTLSQYRIAVARLREVFAEFNADQVSPHHVAQMMDHFRATPNMANRMRTVLRMAFDHAVLMGYCQSNPVTSVPRHKERRRDRYLTDTEYLAIWQAGSETLRCIMDVAYLTGQRIGDVLAIRLSDIDADGIHIRQQKTGKRLLILWNDDLRNAVERARNLFGRRTARIYLLGQRNGRIRSYGGVRDLFRRACQRAGIDGVTLHDIRAKAITDAKRAGLDAQALGGHSTEAMTNRYVRDRAETPATPPSFRQMPGILDSSKRK